MRIFFHKNQNLEKIEKNRVYNSMDKIVKVVTEKLNRWKKINVLSDRQFFSQNYFRDFIYLKYSPIIYNYTI